MPRKPPALNANKLRKTADEKRAGYIRPRIMPGTFVYNEAKDEYKARFSKVYKPAGHNFTRNFVVINSAYWLKYGLLEYADVNLYNALSFFAEADLHFTLDGLAYRCHRGRDHIRASLDCLENVELIYCLTQEDVHGQPNYYVIRTPFFESSKALTKKVKERIVKAGDELPRSFLATNIERLKAAKAENTAKKWRDDPGAYPDAAARTRQWNSIVTAFKGDMQAAVNFDNIVADIITESRGQRHTLEVFEKILRHECSRNQIDLTPRLREQAHGIRAFYDSFQADAPPRAAHHAPVVADDHEQIETFRQMLESGWTLAQLAKQFSGGFSETEWAKILRSLPE